MLSWTALVTVGQKIKQEWQSKYQNLTNKQVTYFLKKNKNLDDSLECISTFQQSIHRSNASFWNEKRNTVKHYNIWCDLYIYNTVVLKEILEKYSKQISREPT